MVAIHDQPSGGSPVHGILEHEAEELVAPFHEWGETDRSHRKLAHRGFYLGRVWGRYVCPHAEHEGRARAFRKARQAGLDQARTVVRRPAR